MRLRRLERTDLDYVLEWADDPAFREFVFGDSKRSWRHHGAQALALLGGTLTTQNAGIGFFLISTDDGQQAGLAGIYEMHWRNRHCATSLFLTAPHRSGGNLEQAWIELIRYCLDELNLHRVFARVSAADRESCAALERTGARREVVYRGHLLHDGQPADMYGYGMLRREYEAAIGRVPAGAGAEA